MQVATFHELKINKAILKWKQIRINCLLYSEKKEFLTKRVREEHFVELKVLFISHLIQSQYSFEGIIKRVKLLNEYVNLNLEAFEKVRFPISIAL